MNNSKIEMSSNPENSQDINQRLSEGETDQGSQTQNQSDESSKNIDFCCCCSLKRPSFYLFINMLDLVFITTVTSLMAALGGKSEMANVAILNYIAIGLASLNGILFIIALAAFVVYLIKLKYSTSIHKVYAWLRIIISAMKYGFLLEECGYGRLGLRDI